MDAITITDFIAWPSYDKNDRIDFGNSDIEVITTHFNDIRENSDVKIDDALTEWDMTKSNFYGRLVGQTNINMNHVLLNTFSFFVYL